MLMLMLMLFGVHKRVRLRSRPPSPMCKPPARHPHGHDSHTSFSSEFSSLGHVCGNFVGYGSCGSRPQDPQ